METKTSGSPRIKRHTLIIKKALQAKFILLVMASVFFAVCLVGWEIYYTFGRDIVRDLMDPGLYELFQQLSRVLVAKIAIYMAVVGIVAVFLSHKLAGPIYRFEKSAHVLGGGDLTHRVHLRKGDELMDLQDEFNSMAEALHVRVAKDRQLAQRIAGQMQDLTKGKDISPDLARRLKELETEVNHLTADFKV
ncbi:MAG TPA: methyl-accepting chemotaxis protein [Elusimicrobiota bacterium]|nr:methyl-accepting chemotaxis protein [Elusimicrobiota bacterium]